MRALNNKRRMLTRGILGLFLTATLPLSVSTFTFSARALENDTLLVSLNQTVADFSKKIGKPSEILFNKFSPETLGQVTLDQVKEVNPEEKSAFNFGHALYSLQDVLTKQEEPDFLNLLLKKLSKNDGDYQESIASDASTKAFCYYMNALDIISNETADLPSTGPQVSLNLEAAKRLVNVMISSFAYQNISLEQLKFHRSREDELKQKGDVEYQILKFGENGNAGKNKEKENVTAIYESAKRELEKKLFDTEESKKNAEESSLKSTSHIRSLKGTTQDLQEKLKELKTRYDTQMREIDGELAQKKIEDQKKEDQLRKENQEKQDLTHKYVSYLFSRLDTSFFTAFKTKVYSKYSNLPSSREYFDYTGFDALLAKNPLLLEEARALLYEATKESLENYSGKFKKYPKEIVRNSFLSYLGFKQEDQERFEDLRNKKDLIRLEPRTVLSVYDEFSETEDNSGIKTFSLSNSNDPSFEEVRAENKVDAEGVTKDPGVVIKEAAPEKIIYPPLKGVKKNKKKRQKAEKPTFFYYPISSRK